MVAVVPTGVLPQAIIISSGPCLGAGLAAVGWMVKVCCTRCVSGLPGLSELSMDRLRCDNMSLEAVEIPCGEMASRSKLISVTMHWCVPRMRFAIDCKVPVNGPPSLGEG